MTRLDAVTCTHGLSWLRCWQAHMHSCSWHRKLSVWGRKTDILSIEIKKWTSCLILSSSFGQTAVLYLFTCIVFNKCKTVLFNVILSFLQIMVGSKIHVNVSISSWSLHSGHFDNLLAASLILSCPFLQKHTEKKYPERKHRFVHIVTSEKTFSPSVAFLNSKTFWLWFVMHIYVLACPPDR